MLYVREDILSSDILSTNIIEILLQQGISCALQSVFYME